MAEKPICSIPECGKRSLWRGLCNPHYLRWQRYGDPLVTKGTSPGKPLAELNRSLSEAAPDQCWLWPFARHDYGYGMIYIDGRVQRAHRVVCEIVHGAPPTPNHDAAHSCGKGHFGCINRHHLRWATRTENVADAAAHGTQARGTRCKHAKLTEADVHNIRLSAKADGQRFKPSATAKSLGVSSATVYHVLSGDTWAWLETPGI